MRLRFGLQHSRFLSILTRFVHYYSPFWGREVIYMLVEHQGVLTSRLSTLTVLADSGPFHGLLLTVLGSRSDFHNESRGALTFRSSTLAVFIDSDPFYGLLLTVLGLQSDFHSC